MTAFTDRIASALGTSPITVPLITSGCGAGRTSVLLKLRERIGSRECQYIDVERVATTPERFLQALMKDSPFRSGLATAGAPAVKSPREAFDTCLAFLSTACTAEGKPATFLLDEVLDLRTFESFPGLRTVVPDLVTALEATPNRFVLATRFTARAARLTTRTNGRVAMQPLPRMAVSDVLAALAETPHHLGPAHAEEELARTIHALTDGRPCYVRAMLDAISSMTDAGDADPVGSMVALLGCGGALSARCRFSYELRLHRARGYGALKAILNVLAEEEPLTLTAIAQRLARTPGSTKDYLGWLEDVDLIAAERKRYRITDPVLRLWIRIEARSTPPTDDVIVREVQRFAMLRLAAAARAEAAPRGEGDCMPVGAAANGGALDANGKQRSSGIVEFD